MTERQAVVYMIRCAANGRFYVGSSRAHLRRWTEHRRRLTAGDHENPRLQACAGKYGIGALAFSVLETVPLSDQFEAEQRWLEALSRSSPSLVMNVVMIAGKPPSFDELSTAAQQKIRLQVSERTRRMHKDPEFAARHVARLTRLNSDPEFKEANRRRASVHMSRLNADPAFKERNRRLSAELGSRTMQRLHTDPEFQRRHLDRLRKLNADAESRGRCIEATKVANSKKCRCTTAEGTVRYFRSAKEASNVTGVKEGTITFRCRKRAVGRDGSKWEFV